MTVLSSKSSILDVSVYSPVEDTKRVSILLMQTTLLVLCYGCGDLITEIDYI